MEIKKIKAAKYVFTVCAYCVVFFIGQGAVAQVIPGEELPPPNMHQMVDSYGMEMVGGSVKIPGRNVSIGTSQSGISYSEGGWNSGNHNFQGRIIAENTIDFSFPDVPPSPWDPKGIYLTVSTGSSTAKFKKDGAGSSIEGAFSIYEGRGTLTLLSARKYLYMSGDGTEYLFDADYSNTSDSFGLPRYKANIASLTQIKKPDGEIIDITYRHLGDLPMGNQGVAEIFGFQSAASSLGWMVKVNVDNPAANKNSITAINRAVDYCSLSSGYCSPFSHDWQKSTIEQNYHIDRGINIPNDFDVTYAGTIIDAEGHRATLAFDYYYPTSTYDVTYVTGEGVTKIFTKYYCSEIEAANSLVTNGLPAGAHSCKGSLSGNVGRYISLNIGGHKFDYTNIKTTGGDSNSNGQVPTVYLAKGPEAEVSFRAAKPSFPDAWMGKLYDFHRYGWQDGLIRSVRNAKDTFHTDYEYDDRGNILFIRKYPRDDAGAPLVTSATYPNCRNSTSVKNCNKPLTVTSDAGVKTTYTYDPVHGGVLSATLAAVNGVQAQTRYYYEQKRALVKNSTGNTIPGAPVWRLVEISSCRTKTLDTCVGSADERRVVIDYDVDNVVPGVETANVLPVRETVMLGDGSIQLTTITLYDIYGNVKSVDGPKHGTYDTVYYFYDALRQRVAEVGVDPDGSGPQPRQAVRTFYNGDGQVSSVRTGVVNTATLEAVDAMFAAVRVDTEYDSSIGLPSVERIYAGGVLRNITQKSYNDKLKLECVAQRLDPTSFNSLPSSACALGSKGPEGNDRITRYEYDEVGQVTKIWQAYGTVNERVYKTNYYRADNGLLEKVEDALGNTTFYEYDGYRRPNKTIYPSKSNGSVESSGDYTQISYSGALVSTLRLRDGQVISFSLYDELARLKTKTGAVRETFSYDNFGNVTDHTNTTLGYQPTTKTAVFSYNALGWKLSEKVGSDLIGYKYNNYGQRTRLTWPDNFYVTYDYSVNGYQSDQLQHIKEYNSKILASYFYDQYARRELLVRGNGVTTSYEYDDFSRLEQLETAIVGSSNDVSESFEYTVAGQLKSRTVDTTSNNYYFEAAAGESVNYGEPNALNQITTVNGNNLNYDNRGNLTKDNSGATYSYNANNLLRSRVGGGNSTTLTYDSENRLSRLVHNGVTTDFRYDGQDLIAEKNTAGAVTARYVHGPGVDDPIVWYVGAGTDIRRYLAENYQGSIVGVTNNSGEEYTTNAYDEYGNPSPSNKGRFQYTGQMWLGDDIGLYYYKARIYSPDLGRFLQTDPVGYEDQMNLYAYVYNDPMNNIDPSGKCAWDGCVVEGGVAIGTAAVYAVVATAVATGVCVKFCGDIKEGIENAVNSVFNESSEGTPDLPGELVGEQDSQAGQQGNRHNSGPLSGENGGTGNAEEDFGALGGTEGVETNDKGHQVSPNGVRLRPGTDSSGPRIDVPANGEKPHETLHYPK